MPVVPKPTPFDGAQFQNALDENIRRPDGQPYAVFKQFRDWKLWVESLRDHLEALRVGVFGSGGIKEDLDRHTVRLNNQDARLDVLEAASTSAPFPGSG
ncbi:MAG TPA: hypothetical protein VLA89_06545 [Gemmatimonadales bacterium]|nr:hypothetical protein [Gemmatimonadales bacterium]